MYVFRTDRAMRAAGVLLAAALAFASLEARAAGGVVETLTLDQGIDPAAAGALDPGDARLPTDLWAGSDRAEVARLVTGLPAGYASPTVADLARRVLAVAAPPPKGAAVAPSFALARAEALLRMGWPGLASRLMGAAPRKSREVAGDRLLMEGALLALDTASACAAAQLRLGASDDPEFAKTSAFCEALTGDKARAEFATTLLAEKAPNDAAFYGLMDFAVGHVDKPGRAVQRLKTPSPLHLAMMRALDYAPAKPFNLKDAPYALAADRLLAGDPVAGLDIRREAAWRAYSRNALDVAVARALFSAAAGAAPERKTAAGRIADAYAAAEAAAPGPERALALAKLLALGREAGAAEPVAELARPMMVDLFALASGPDIALRIAHGLLLTADPNGARRWLASLEARRAVPGAAAAASRLKLMLALAEGQEEKPLDGPGAVLWLAAINGGDAAEGPAKAALMAKLRQALGLAVPPSLAGAALAQPDAALTLALLPIQTAAAERRIGETALRAAALVSAPEAVTAHAVAAVAALMDVGLEEEARQLAVETAIAAGL